MYKIRDLSLSLFYYNCEHLSKFDFSKESLHLLDFLFGSNSVTDFFQQIKVNLFLRKRHQMKKPVFLILIHCKNKKVCVLLIRFTCNFHIVEGPDLL